MWLACLLEHDRDRAALLLRGQRVRAGWIVLADTVRRREVHRLPPQRLEGGSFSRGTYDQSPSPLWSHRLPAARHRVRHRACACMVEARAVDGQSTAVKTARQTAPAATDWRQPAVVDIFTARTWRERGHKGALRQLLDLAVVGEQHRAGLRADLHDLNRRARAGAGRRATLRASRSSTAVSPRACVSGWTAERLGPAACARRHTPCQSRRRS